VLNHCESNHNIFGVFGCQRYFFCSFSFKLWETCSKIYMLSVYHNII